MNNIEELITGVTVSYNTKELLEKAISSIRKFYPKMKLIIVDGSNRSNPCYTYIQELANENTRVFHTDENIGHGRGLCIGINYINTPYFLTFDSDIEMMKSPLQEMLDMIEEDTYGVGYIEPTDFGGHEWGSRKNKMNEGPMKYLHPYFCLIQKKEYDKLPPFIHHGAPAVNTMLAIHRKGNADKVLKEFKGLGHTASSGWTWISEMREYILHNARGTRDTNLKSHLPEIPGKWEKVIDPGIGGITCITCTGDRPETFALCKRWIVNQTVKPIQWIIVDDGINPIEVPNLPYVNYIRREPKQADPQHTMILNMQEAVKHIIGDKILFWEDDEYYAPDYIFEMSKLMDVYEVVGIGRSKYYYLPGKTYYSHNNMGHASLAQTGFRRSFLPEFNSILPGDSFLDIRIWNIINPGETHLKETGKHEYVSKNGRGFIFNDKDKSLYVGMKGMPGRKGIGSGHKGIGPEDTPEYNVLHGWIPNEDDFKIYSKLDFSSFSRPVTRSINTKKQPIISNTRINIDRRKENLKRLNSRMNIDFI